MRIVDILLKDDDDEEGGGEIDAHKTHTFFDLAAFPSAPLSAASSLASSSSASASTAASSARSLLSRFLITIRKPFPEGSRCWYRNKKKKINKLKQEEGGCGMIGISIDSMPDEPVTEILERHEQERRVELSVASGRKREDASFCLGMGAGLVLLMAKSTTEFNKMMEMQRQIETLLKEIKDFVQSKGTIPVFTKSSNKIASSASDCCGEINTSKTLSLENFITLDKEEARLAKISDGLTIEDANFENRSCPKLDQLAEELEIELKRLELNLEGEDSTIFSSPRGFEPAWEDFGLSERFTKSFDDVDDECNEEKKSEICGIPPRILERRLHELLQSRQSERIAELESKLEFTKRKLQEKEGEASWWRDTAMSARKHTLLD